MASPRESYYPAVCVRACARLCRIVSNVVNKSELGCVWRREYQFGMMRPQRNDGDSGRLTSAAPSAGRANGQSFPISSFLYSFSSSSFLQMRPLLPCAQSVGKYSLAMRAGLPALSFFLSLSLSDGKLRECEKKICQQDSRLLSYLAWRYWPGRADWGARRSAGN